MTPVDEQTRPTNNNKKIIIVVLTVLAALVVTAGILFIAVVVPAWKTVAKAGNEASAAQSIQTIRVLQAQYNSKHQGRFAPNFDELIKVMGLDEKFAGTSPVVNGYIFTMKVEATSSTKPAFYSINTDPQAGEGTQSSGLRHFYIDSTLSTTKITEENSSAKADDPSL